MASLSACSTLAASTAEESGDDIAGLVRFGAYVRTLDTAELERQHVQLLTEYQASPSSSTAIKLSLVLSHQTPNAETLAEALAILAETCNGRGDDAELGRLIYHLLSQRYLATNEDDSASALLAEERARNARLNEELAAAKLMLAASEQQRAVLVRQLDALKAIEEQINVDGAAAEK